jgi:hypothetical protein
MASVTGVQRPSILVTILALASIVLLGLLVINFITGLVLALIRLALVLLALYLIARIGWYLLRKGQPRA